MINKLEEIDYILKELDPTYGKCTRCEKFFNLKRSSSVKKWGVCSKCKRLLPWSYSYIDPKKPPLKNFYG